MGPALATHMASTARQIAANRYPKFFRWENRFDRFDPAKRLTFTDWTLI